uniref:Uncharacterized protein n=1 Tax=Romanomermis culicivorax TaxID=13658 RepID=A0A915JGL8_ROMCU
MQSLCGYQPIQWKSSFQYEHHLDGFGQKFELMEDIVDGGIFHGSSQLQALLNRLTLDYWSLLAPGIINIQDLRQMMKNVCHKTDMGKKKNEQALKNIVKNLSSHCSGHLLSNSSNDLKKDNHPTLHLLL